MSKNKKQKNRKLFGISKDKEFLTENLSVLIESGMTVTDAILSVETDIKSKALREVLANVRNEIDQGSSIWKAFERSRLFEDHEISLVRIGEESGKLIENLRVLAIQEQKNRNFKTKLRSAMLYPAFVLILTLGVGIGIAWFILPRLATVFSQMRIDLPLVTQYLIKIGSFLQANGTWFIPSLLISIIVIIYILFFNKKTHFIGQAIAFKVPGLKGVLKQIEIARFGFLFGTLLGAGIPILEALSSIEKATEFSLYSKFYAHLRSRIEKGNSIEKSFKSYNKVSKLFPTPVQQMLFSSELSGNLPETLKKIGKIYEDKTETSTKDLAVILEPILLIIVWLGVLGVAIAVILPIYSLIGGFQTGETNPVRKERTVEERTVITSEVPVGQIMVIEEIESVNIRKEPSVDSEIEQEVYSGEIYQYVDFNDEWYLIELDTDSKGWILGDYVQIYDEKKEKTE